MKHPPPIAVHGATPRMLAALRSVYNRGVVHDMCARADCVAAGMLEPDGMSGEHVRLTPKGHFTVLATTIIRALRRNNFGPPAAKAQATIRRLGWQAWLVAAIAADDKARKQNT